MKEYKTISLQLLFSYGNQILTVALNAFLFVTLTRYLTKQMYGVVSLYFASIVLAFTYINLALPQYVLKELSGMAKHRREQQFSQLLLFQILFSAGLVILLGLPVIWIVEFKLIAALVCGITFAASINTLGVHYLYATQRLITGQTALALQNLWMLAVVAYALVAGYLPVPVIFVLRLLFSTGVLLSLVFFFLIKEIHLVLPQRKILRKALGFSLPLLPVSVSQYLITAADRYIIGFFIGATAVGVYTYYYSILNFVTTFSLLPLGMLFSYVAKAHKKDRDRAQFFLNASTKYTLLLLLPALVGLFMLRYEIVTMLTGPKYVDDIHLLVVFLLFPILHFLSMLYYRACMLVNDTAYLAKTYCKASILNILLNLGLIPPYGIVGAAVATLLTYLALAWLLYRNNAHLIQWRWHYLQVHKMCLACGIMALSLTVVHPTAIIGKLLSIVYGAGVYFLTFAFFGGFVDDERKLLRSFLGKQ